MAISTKYPFLVLIIFMSILGVRLQADGQDSGQHAQEAKFGGVGISVDIDSAQQLPYIVEVLSGQPGAMAGLRSGDHILAIGHWNTKHKSREKVAVQLRGRVGSTIKLTILRGSRHFEVEITRKEINIEKEPANLCDGLDQMLKSAADTFNGIKKPETKFVEMTYDVNWIAKMKIRGFSEILVRKIFSEPEYLSATFYRGKDSIQAVNKFDRLVSDIRGCLPYTVSESFQETNSSDPQGFTNTFIISQVRAGNPAQIKGSRIVLSFVRIPKDKVYSVVMEYCLGR